ncbi:hypothetical protein BBO_06643 [Beauveria brongniartii RCEF 3172]|uniref:Uncharacterized protein n=1 Tax=Beauveria brongniartii RCEF 3172 TaxID=1081107 RepID=A0A169YFD8_9HYPO|nr:hypothetical protein BBO_06643 [Beauveria brongniartii RCEF 3172]
MPSSPREPRPDGFDRKEREEEVINLIEMSIMALSHMKFNPEPDMENMAKWLANEAVNHSKSLEGEVQAKAALKQLSDCCGARNEWGEALIALEQAKSADEDGWTPDDQHILRGLGRNMLSGSFRF